MTWNSATDTLQVGGSMKRIALVGLALALACGDDGGGGTDTAPPDVGDVCSSDEACDDGLFCNGTEACLPDSPAADALGCVRGDNPCLEGQRCDADALECRSLCSVIADADGDGVDAIACGGADCDDTNPNRFPGNAEICDEAGVDEDCDPTTFGERDRDGDGFIDAACCNGDTCGDDCSDERRDMKPGFAETCDALDNDCDGMVDETASVPGFVDNDHDLHGDPSMPIVSCPGSPRFAVVGDDCEDDDPEVHGAQLEICDGKDNDCDGMVDESPAAVTWYPDDDADGFGTDGDRTVVSCEPVRDFSLRPSDCNDMDRETSPAARELCNARDDNCNGRADFMIRPGDFEDDDGDGFADMACGGNDCDDANPAIFPGAPEICDGLDNNCDGVADGDDAMALWFLDRDGDGFGDESEPPIESCNPQPGRISRGGDCNDMSASVNPSVPDFCDGEDDDCDGAIDENAFREAYYIDSDGDGFGDSASPVIFACLPTPGRAPQPDDCDDGNPATFPTAAEICDLEDNDCDGVSDEDAPTTWYVDADGDGHGVPEGSIETCGTPLGFAALDDDCDDGNPARFPSATESCDLVDNDCDDTVDEDGATACPVSGGVGICTSGICSVASCTGTFEDCDSDFATGCEVDTRTNAAHCGGCGMPCSLGDTCGRAAASVCDDASIVSLVIGDMHSFALMSTGTLLGWGSGGSGRIGNGSTTNVPVPTPIMENVIQASAGSAHSCAVSSTRSLYCWGENTYGQLGDGTQTRRSTPAPVPELMNVRQVACGDDHTCAVLMDGTVWCWGRQRDGRLGDGVSTSTSRLVPHMIEGVGDAVEVMAGERFSCIRRPLGGGGFRVQCFGSNESGYLGFGSLEDRSSPSESASLPSDIVGFANGNTANSVCVRLSSGTARCWGSSALGTLGNGAINLNDAVPTPVAMTVSGGTEATGIVAMCTGIFMSCALVATGTPGEAALRCTGADDFGQMGDGDGSRTDASRLQPVVDETGGPATIMNATHVACGRQHGCVARADGSLWCWGNDDRQQLGNGGGTIRVNPTPLRVTGF